MATPDTATTAATEKEKFETLFTAQSDTPADPYAALGPYSFLGGLCRDANSSLLSSSERFTVSAGLAIQPARLNYGFTTQEIGILNQAFAIIQAKVAEKRDPEFHKIFDHIQENNYV